MLSPVGCEILTVHPGATGLTLRLVDRADKQLCQEKPP